ncbi:MAG: response regulator transcription factor [Chloroflexi bacterium]|nr:response regulator transcription factor [Chloroflexota bacterium]
MATRQMGAAARAEAQAVGRTLDRGAAFALAAQLLQAPESDSPDVLQPVEALLTRRELEIARGLAQGLTNRGIAAQMFISEGTVRAHVEHILRKLGVRSRAEVAACLRSPVA